MPKNWYRTASNGHTQAGATPPQSLPCAMPKNAQHQASNVSGSREASIISEGEVSTTSWIRRSRRTTPLPWTCDNLTSIALYRALGFAGAWVSSPEGRRHATAKPSRQQLLEEYRPSSDPTRCPGLPQGSGPDWLQSSPARDKRASHRRNVVVVVVVVAVVAEWLYFSKRIIIDKRPGLSDLFVDFRR